MILLVLGCSASAENQIPAEVWSAKTIYLVNKTENKGVLTTAADQFTKWGRFVISQSQDDADLIIVFTHNNRVSRWGNVGVLEMEVFVRGQRAPVFIAKNALKLIMDRQHPTKACISDFRKRLEAKH